MDTNNLKEFIDNNNIVLVSMKAKDYLELTKLIVQCERNREKARKRQRELSGADAVIERRKKEPTEMHLIGYMDKFILTPKNANKTLQ